jgi:hypothetical protein
MGFLGSHADIFHDEFLIPLDSSHFHQESSSTGEQESAISTRAWIVVV